MMQQTAVVTCFAYLAITGSAARVLEDDKTELARHSGWSGPSRRLPSDINQEFKRLSSQQVHSRKLQQASDAGSSFGGTGFNQASITHPSLESPMLLGYNADANSEAVMLNDLYTKENLSGISPGGHALPILQFSTVRSTPAPAFDLSSPSPGPESALQAPDSAPAGSPSVGTAADTQQSIHWVARAFPSPSESASAAIPAEQPLSTPSLAVGQPILQVAAPTSPSQVSTSSAAQDSKAKVTLSTASIVLVCVGVFAGAMLIGILMALFARCPGRLGGWFHCCFGHGYTGGNHIRGFAGIANPRKKIVIRPPPLEMRKPPDNDEGLDRQCDICFEHYTNNKDIVLFPCDHFTCQQCYKNIMDKEKKECLCPYCRISLLEPLKEKDPRVISTDGSVPRLGERTTSDLSVQAEEQSQIGQGAREEDFTEVDLSNHGAESPKDSQDEDPIEMRAF